VRHFFTVGEMLGPILLSIHNLTFYQRLMSNIRSRIESDDFGTWAKATVERYQKLFAGLEIKVAND
jgi:queuine tRNA-ribosyltransferase